jgi:SulP family sulfate permease
MLRAFKQSWLSNVRGDILAGLVVALALIPEAIAFSIIAGVDPKVGLYASFCIAVITAIVGGRPGMISAATGAMALVMVTLVRDHGLEYLLAATLLTGMLQILAGVMKLGLLMRFVSRSVVTGFVNALAILIFLAQLPEITGENANLTVVAVLAGGLTIIYGLPYITKAVPSPLVCIVVMTGIAMFFGLDIRTVGDMGELPDSLPVFLWPDVPLNLETLTIIFPYALTLAVVGLLESMMTATIIDDLTDTPSNKNRECVGQGVANIGAGLIGGMAGCAMIGQSVINVKSGGRKRLSSFTAGVVLLILVVFLSEWVSQIPMAALGVLLGVLLSALFFARKVGDILYIGSELSEDGMHRSYHVIGQVFFTSADQFIEGFDFKEAVDKVTIDLTRAHFWDITAISSLDKVVIKFRREGAEVEMRGLNEASATLVDRFAVHDKPDAVERLMGH